MDEMHFMNVLAVEFSCPVSCCYYDIAFSHGLYYIKEIGQREHKTAGYGFKSDFWAVGCFIRVVGVFGVKLKLFCEEWNLLFFILGI